MRGMLGLSFDEFPGFGGGGGLVHSEEAEYVEAESFQLGLNVGRREAIAFKFAVVHG